MTFVRHVLPLFGKYRLVISWCTTSKTDDRSDGRIVTRLHMWWMNKRLSLGLSDNFPIAGVPWNLRRRKLCESSIGRLYEVYRRQDLRLDHRQLSCEVVMGVEFASDNFLPNMALNRRNMLMRNG